MKGVIIVVVIALLYCVAATPRVTVGDEVGQTMEEYLLKNTAKFAALLQNNNKPLWDLIVKAPNATEGKANFTVFAPNDKAVEAAGNGLPNLANTLYYHVHTGSEVGSFYLNNYATLDTLYRDPSLHNVSQVLSFSQADKNASIYINRQAQILVADVLATNGIIHVIGSVISIPTQVILGQFKDSTQFSTLNGVMNQSNFNYMSNHATFLAPNNEAWTQLFKDQPALQRYFSSGYVSARLSITKILRSHITNSIFYADSLANGTTAEFHTDEATSIYVHKNNGTGAVTIRFSELGKDVATVTVPNIILANGVSHGIDHVLLPQGLGIMPFPDALRVLNCSNFLKRLEEQGLNQIINDTTPNTYYIPTDSVANVLSLNATELLYYGTPGNVSFTDTAFYTPSLSNLASLNNRPQQLLLDHVVVNNVTTFRVNGHAVSAIPYTTDKGSIIYTISDLNTLPGKTLDVLNAKTSSDDFTAFTELYTLPTLKNITNLYNINNSTSTTLFVPTNAAFSKLPLGVVGFLRMSQNASTEFATQILNNHIVPNTLLYNIRGEQTLTTVDGNRIELKPLANGRVTLNNLTDVVPIPLLTANGAIFSIDEVILPPVESVQFTAIDILQGLAYENTTGPSLGKYDESVARYERTGYNHLLTDDKQPFTLFVATDAAWDNAADTYYENTTERLVQLFDVLSYGIVYENILELNVTNEYYPSNNTNNTLTITQAGGNEPTKVTLRNHLGTYEATVVMNTTTSYGQRIYGLDRVLGVDTKSGDSGHKLPVWAWVVIIVAGILVGLILLAVIVGAAWYLFVRPNREGYRHIN